MPSTSSSRRRKWSKIYAGNFAELIMVEPKMGIKSVEEDRRTPGERNCPEIYAESPFVVSPSNHERHTNDFSAAC